MHISGNTVNFLAVETASGIMIPVLIFVIWMKASKTKYLPAFIGAATHLVFGQIVLSYMNTTILKTNGTASFFEENVLVYALYGGFLSAAFEEFGRYVSFRFVFAEHYKCPKDAISYGIGHGGLECFFTLGINSLFYLLLAYSISSGIPSEQLVEMLGGKSESLESMLTVLNGIGTATVFAAIIERISVIVLNVCLSVLMLQSVKSSPMLAAVCVLLHGTVYSVIMLMAGTKNILFCEILLLAAVSATSFFILYPIAKKES